MAALPRFRLRTIFLVFVCAAVGLAIGFEPPAKTGGFSVGNLLHFVHWVRAILAAASIVVIIGLLQQIRQFRRWARSSERSSRADTFGLQLAIVWRRVLALTLACCIVAAYLAPRRLLPLSTTPSLMLDLFPDVLWFACMVAVLFESLSRWRARKPRPAALRDHSALWWVTGVVFALLVLPQVAGIHFLAHLATSGIEANIPLRFQRAGAFPIQATEGFRLTWLSLGAVAAVGIAILLWWYASRTPCATRTKRLLAGAGYVLSLAVAAAFCIWFYRTEFYRVSPDLAGSKWTVSDLVWPEWLAPTTLVAALVSVGAFQLARRDECWEPLSDKTRADDYDPLHDSVPCLLLLTIAALLYELDLLHCFVDSMTWFGGSFRWSELFYDLLAFPDNYLALAVLVLSLQLLWYRWRRRGEQPDWQLAVVDGRRFVLNWVALAVLVVVGIPTVAAYAFAFWLGPWYRLGS